MAKTNKELDEEACGILILLTVSTSISFVSSLMIWKYAVPVHVVAPFYFLAAFLFLCVVATFVTD